jgi:hypothetical protein
MSDDMDCVWKSPGSRLFISPDSLLFISINVSQKSIHPVDEDPHFGWVSSVIVLSRDHWSPVLSLLYGRDTGLVPFPTPGEESFLMFPRFLILWFLFFEGGKNSFGLWEGVSRIGVKERRKGVKNFFDFFSPHVCGMCSELTTQPHVWHTVEEVDFEGLGIVKMTKFQFRYVSLVWSFHTLGGPGLRWWDLSRSLSETVQRFFFSLPVYCVLSLTSWYIRSWKWSYSQIF